jgi:hypothetical protein
MKLKLSLCVVLVFFGLTGLEAQSSTRQWATCFSTSNQKSIDQKMEKLLEKVSKETACPLSELAYTVVTSYTGFYTAECRHLPKKIVVTAQGKEYTYLHRGLSGAVGYWLLGSWKLEKKNA